MKSQPSRPSSIAQSFDRPGGKFQIFETPFNSTKRKSCKFLYLSPAFSIATFTLGSAIFPSLANGSSPGSDRHVHVRRYRGWCVAIFLTLWCMYCWLLHAYVFRHARIFWSNLTLKILVSNHHLPAWLIDDFYGLSAYLKFAVRWGQRYFYSAVDWEYPLVDSGGDSHLDGWSDSL